MINFLDGSQLLTGRTVRKSSSSTMNSNVSGPSLKPEALSEMGTDESNTSLSQKITQNSKFVFKSPSYTGRREIFSNATEATRPREKSPKLLKVARSLANSSHLLERCGDEDQPHLDSSTSLSSVNDFSCTFHSELSNPPLQDNIDRNDGAEDGCSTVRVERGLRSGTNCGECDNGFLNEKKGIDTNIDYSAMLAAMPEVVEQFNHNLEVERIQIAREHDSMSKTCLHLLSMPLTACSGDLDKNHKVHRISTCQSKLLTDSRQESYQRNSVRKTDTQI